MNDGQVMDREVEQKLNKTLLELNPPERSRTGSNMALELHRDSDDSENSDDEPLDDIPVATKTSSVSFNSSQLSAVSASETTEPFENINYSVDSQSQGDVVSKRRASVASKQSANTTKELQKLRDDFGSTLSKSLEKYFTKKGSRAGASAKKDDEDEEESEQEKSSRKRK